MRFKENIKIKTDDFFYDLFDEKIKVEDLLEDEKDINTVKNAKQVLEDLLDSLESKDLIIYE